MPTRIKLGLECLILFFVLPSFFYLVRHHIAFKMIIILAVASAICGFILFKDPGFNCQTLRRLDSIYRSGPSISCIFLPASFQLALTTVIFLPDRSLAFPWSRPMLWTAVIILYPLLMAWPQELVFRGFFFIVRKNFFQPSTPHLWRVPTLDSKQQD